MPKTLIIVPGKARSGQSTGKGRAVYENEVHLAASQHFRLPLKERNLSIDVHHFRAAGDLVDLDNLLKAILDGLKGAAYEDDSQVARVCAERYYIRGSYTLENSREEWIDYLGKGEDFVSIEVSHLE